MAAQSLPHPILEAVAAARESLKSARDVQPVFMTAAQRQAAVEEIARLEASLAELHLRVVASAGDVAEKAGARDIGAWLAHATRADIAKGRADARLAEALDRRWTRVATAMADGVVSPPQAQVVTAVLEALPEDLDPDLLAKAEDQLVAWCAEFRPSDLRRLGRRLLEVVAPDIAEAEDAKRLEKEEQRAREKTTLRSRLIGDGRARTTIIHSELDRTRLLTYLEAFASPRKSTGAVGGEEDRIPYPRRLGLAFSALLDHLDPSQLPAHGGDATTVMVTIDLESLRGDLASGTIVGGEPLSATAVRRMACTAGIIPVVLGGKGEILDLGRKRRLFSAAQRKALGLRDQQCRAEGCTIPARWCEAHHDLPWSQGGKTDLEHGRLYCSFHHHRAHDRRFVAQTLPNGDTRFHRRA